ncbi:hypothetical protein DM01DRAFT_1337763, partial [Hesseltinella vesiculosa]
MDQEVNHAKLLTALCEGQINVSPDYFALYNSQKVTVYQRHNSTQVSHVTNATLESLSGNPIASIVHVLDTSYKDQPILVLITTDNKDLVHVYWHRILNNTTHLLHFDQQLSGPLSLAAMMGHPFALVKDHDRRDIFKKTNMRHLLVLAKPDSLTLTALLIDAKKVEARASRASLCHVMQVDLSPSLTGTITSIKVLPQGHTGKTLALTEPRILVATSAVSAMILRLRTRNNIVDVVPVFDLKTYLEDHTQPIIRIDGIRVPNHCEMLYAVGQSSAPAAHDAVLAKPSPNTNLHFHMIEWYGNNRRKIIRSFSPAHLDHYTLVTFRLAPSDGSYQVMTVFQSLTNPQDFEIDIWRCDHLNRHDPPRLLAQQLTVDSQYTPFEDIWPTAEGGYLLLHSGQLIEVPAVPGNGDIQTTSAPHTIDFHHPFTSHAAPQPMRRRNRRNRKMSPTPASEDVGNSSDSMLSADDIISVPNSPRLGSPTTIATSPTSPLSPSSTASTEPAMSPSPLPTANPLEATPSTVDDDHEAGSYAEVYEANNYRDNEDADTDYPDEDSYQDFLDSSASPASYDTDNDLVEPSSPIAPSSLSANASLDEHLIAQSSLTLSPDAPTFLTPASTAAASTSRDIRTADLDTLATGSHPSKDHTSPRLPLQTVAEPASTTASEPPKLAQENETPAPAMLAGTLSLQESLSKDNVCPAQDASLIDKAIHASHASAIAQDNGPAPSQPSESCGYKKQADQSLDGYRQAKRTKTAVEAFTKV